MNFSDRAAAREKSLALRNAQIEAELQNATFHPEIATMSRRAPMDAPPRSHEELVREQMKSLNPEERPLPTTLPELNLINDEISIEIDSLNAAMRTECSKEPKVAGY